MGTAIARGMGSSGVALPGDMWLYWVRQAGADAVRTLLCFLKSQSSLGKTFPIPTGSLQKERIS